MANTGIAPLDPTTLVGRTRALIGDTAYAPLEPPVDGQGDYNNFSDAEVEAFLVAGGNSPSRATGYAYLEFAAIIASGTKNIATDDLKIDNTKKLQGFLDIAKMWFGRADDEDSAVIAADVYFDLVPTTRPRPVWC